MPNLRVLALAATVVLLAAGCGDDDDTVDAGSPEDGTTEPAPGGSSGEVPDRPAALLGEITEVTPFEPVTEDCIPAEDLDPDGAVSSDDPPICTPEDNDVIGTVLVEEVPGVQEGRKISYTVSTDTVITGGGVEGFDDLVAGQQVESWVAGDVCAESYPEQCGAEAIRVIE